MDIPNDPPQEIVKKMVDASISIYEAESFSNGESIMCSIHDSFHKESEQTHNCIGCNFSDYSELLHSALKRFQNEASALEVFSGTILYAYLMIERFEEIFKIIKLDEGYKLKHFQIFGKIRRWTNFLKHPKAFMLVHHPEYMFQLVDNLEKTREIILLAHWQPSDSDKLTFVDQEFIDKYYASDTNNSKLYAILTNKKDVFVIFPKLTDLITDFCIAQKKFIDIISNNEVYREILDGKTTLKDYYTSPPEADQIVS